MSKIVKTKNFDKFSNAETDSLILYRPADSSSNGRPSVFYKDSDSSIYKYSGSNIFVNKITHSSSDELQITTALFGGGIMDYGMPGNTKSFPGDIFVYINEDTDGVDDTVYKVWLKISQGTTQQNGCWLKILETTKLLPGNPPRNDLETPEPEPLNP